MTFYLHGVEGDDGRWTCQRGRTVIDPAMGHHPDPEEALTHLREVSATLQGTFLLLLHYVDGTLARYDTLP
jgi:hypothetical protein